MHNIYTSIQPFLLVIKVFGLFSVSFEGPTHQGRIKIKILDIINLLLKAILSLYLLQNTTTDDGEQSYGSALANTAWGLVLRCSAFSLLLLLVYQIIKQKSVIEFFNLINKIDNQVRNFI
jgi:hypothetical protein